MESIWRKTTALAPRPPLSGDLETEAVVIGGGLAGVLTAFFLQEKGIRTAILEADRLGGGQTGNTTAKITAQHGMIYEKLTRQLGADLAGQYARANQRAVETYRRLVGERDIDCQFRDCPAYLYSTSQADPLREEAHAARRLGLDAAFTTDTELPFPVKGAVRFGHQARFHPLQFLEHMARDLTVYERTRALSVEEDRVETDRGTVRAKYVVFATHFPFVNAPGYYFMRMHQERSYVLSLSGAPKLKGVYLGVDPDGLSFRTAGDQLLLGGGNHRTGENSAGGKYKSLRVSAARLWPDARVTGEWSAQDCMPMDGVPYIGPFAPSRPNWYVATGFGKWGMSSSMVAAQTISAMIAGEAPEDAEVFSPQRFHVSASAANLVEDGKQAVKGLGRRLLEEGRAAVKDLPPGHGGIVEVDGEKVGAYRDEDGEVYLVSPKCPHLGCQVEWNPDEKTWDCPCHGSRFDYKGNLMDDPAQRGLAEER